MTTAAPAAPDRVLCDVAGYAHAVIAGEIVAGELVRLACERHLRDLDTGFERGLRFSQAEADRVFRFFEQLEHTKGQWKGEPLHLERWQQFIIGSAFGWQRWDEDADRWVRRFLVVYIEVPRKNGKTTIVAGVGNFLAFFDREPGAEVYAAATKRDQAKILWSESKRQITALQKKSNRAKSLITVLTANMHSLRNNQKYEPLGADADTTDGLNTHGGLIDELHAHKTRALWDVIEESMAARLQALLFAITTAGAERTTICWEQHDYGIKVLQGVIDDDSFFAFIATVDEEDEQLLDDYFSEPDDNVAEAMIEGVMLVAARANPNLAVSVRRDYLLNKLRKARKTPGLQNSTLRKHFNVWTRGLTRWINVGAWNACEAEPPIPLEGRDCFMALDLAGTTDLNARALLWPDGDGGYDLRLHFWMPEDNVQERVDRDRVPYDTWIRDGWITVTPGNRRSDGVILEQLRRDGREYQVIEIAVDPWQSTNIASELLAEGVSVVDVPQVFSRLNAASEEFESKVATAQLRHDGNPVMAWMVSNVIADEHPDGFRKPSKKKSTERIDGVSATVTALARAVARQEPRAPSKKPMAPNVYV